MFCCFKLLSFDFYTAIDNQYKPTLSINKGMDKQMYIHTPHWNATQQFLTIQLLNYSMDESQNNK